MTDHRQTIRDHIRAPEAECVRALLETAALSPADRQAITRRAIGLVEQIRSASSTGMMELFLEEYGLSTDEGVALMCLAEALLRVPDPATIDALIDDKITPGAWGQHLGQSSSSLVNASTWALLITGAVLDDDSPGVISHTLRSVVKRLGEPVIRTAVARAMREMGQQFVLGTTIEAAMDRAKGPEADGFTYSYDMLGEAAMTDADARRFHLAYSRAITALEPASPHDDIRDNPGISVKLSALFPRYEEAQRDRVMDILVPRTRSLALLAKSVGIGFNIDAEEAARLDLSLDVIEAVVSDPSLADWDGFGIVVQAYGKRAPYVLDWIYDLAGRLDRRFMVRLVKGAYWDTEIKLAQVQGLPSFPVFTHKAATDLSYIACAKKLFAMTDRIYPQFATHNARTVAAVLELAGEDRDRFEFQRLHGMGEALHGIVNDRHKTRSRIYAPVGPHRDLMAYLVRRLLENGANSSFVNQIVDDSVPPEVVAKDPIEVLEGLGVVSENPRTILPPDLFQPERRNARGFDLTDRAELARIDAAREPFARTIWQVSPLTVNAVPVEPAITAVNPADPTDTVAKVINAKPEAVEVAITDARPWDIPVNERSEILNRAADLYEENYGTLFAALAREAGKTLLDCDAELREAVDFIRHYAAQAAAAPQATRKGVFTCISPWNFPVAIFTGQIVAALATGNAVIAKPAEQTPALAWLCCDLLHRAGVPKSVLQLLPGEGRTLGAALSQASGQSGICFTGSTATAQAIYRSFAPVAPVEATLVAETGGLNAMIVDSTALPEQVVRDVIASAFQSAGQRCSALRCLYLQEDVAETIQEMLFGAMDELRMGQPWDVRTDVGPVIDAGAKARIVAHIEQARAEGRVLKELTAPDTGTFVAPTALRVSGIADLGEEIFGPVLHIATYQADQIDQVIADINATGYGLTFGLHTRIDARVQYITDRIGAGNIYVNRNQIGAIVGSQPFGGHGLSGTGPKAGGPLYLEAFRQNPDFNTPVTERLLPGPTGESNRLVTTPRHRVACLGPTKADREAQGAMLEKVGLTPVDQDFDIALYWGDAAGMQALRCELAAQPGRLRLAFGRAATPAALYQEQHFCIDTTAAGGNAALLADTP